MSFDKIPLEGLPLSRKPDAPPPIEPTEPKGSARGVVGQRFRMLNTFIDCSMAELSRAEIAVWFVLYRDTRDGSARTSMEDIARRVGCDPRTVVRAVAALKTKGLLKTIHKGGLNRGSSRYTVRPLAKDG